MWFEPPQTYNDMLPKLNRATAVSTFLFVFVLASLGFVPKLELSAALMPPVADEKLRDWILSFGLVPLGAALVAWVLSSAFEIHNHASKLFQLRYLWEKWFIVEPLRLRALSSLRLNRATVRRVMNDFYYPEVKKIDQHYVHLFWRYALFFWILFEHILVATTMIVVLFVFGERQLSGLFLWLFLVVILAASQFLSVTANKSTDQANQIPIEAVRTYFASLR